MTKSLLMALVSFVASTSIAAPNLGLYEGVTKSGESCSISLSKENKTYLVQMSYALEGQNEGCGFHARNKTESSSRIRIGGGSDNTVCKVSIDLANDGTLVSAEMGIGSHFQFGHDVECVNLQKVN